MAENKGTNIVLAETEVKLQEERLTALITTMHNTAFDLAPIIYYLAEGNAHTLRGYSTFAQYISERFGIGKSTAKNLLAIGRRFAVVKDGAYVIPDNWKAYGFKKLQAIMSLTNEEITANEITSETSYDDIMRCIRAKKQIAAKNDSDSDSDSDSDEIVKDAPTETTGNKANTADVKEAKEAEKEQPATVTIALSSIVKALNSTKTADRKSMIEWLDKQFKDGVQFIQITNK